MLSELLADDSRKLKYARGQNPGKFYQDLKPPLKFKYY